MSSNISVHSLCIVYVPELITDFSPPSENTEKSKYLAHCWFCFPPHKTLLTQGMNHLDTLYPSTFLQYSKKCSSLTSPPSQHHYKSFTHLYTCCSTNMGAGTTQVSKETRHKNRQQRNIHLGSRNENSCRQTILTVVLSWLICTYSCLSISLILLWSFI